MYIYTVVCMKRGLYTGFLYNGCIFIHVFVVLPGCPVFHFYLPAWGALSSFFGLPVGVPCCCVGVVVLA